MNGNGLEERVAKIEGTVEQIDKRLESIEERFESIEERLNHLGDEISDVRKELTNKIDSTFKWTLGILIPMWVTIIGTMVGFFLAVLSK